MSAGLAHDFASAQPRVRRLALRPHHVGLAAVLALAASLDFWNLTQNGYANTYYAGAVRSMLKSWHNFFFVSFDPGGLVSVDKPPLALWLQTLSAKVFGFSSFSILLPEALAGVGAVWLLYLLVARYFGRVAGLAAALALAVSPVSVSVNRDNNPDALLALLLVASVYLGARAAESGRLRWLVGSAVLVGLAFNTKMLAAMVVVPGIALAYLLLPRLRWRVRFLHLAIAAVVLVAVSGAWIAAVDLTPAADRPYVGSTTNNSALSLALDYNGLGRVTGQTGGTSTGGGIGGAFSGSPGAFRLLNDALGDQGGWLLALAVVGGLSALVFALRRRRRRELVLLTVAGVWFAAAAFVFSYSSGIIHTYYLSALAAGGLRPRRGRARRAVARRAPRRLVARAAARRGRPDRVARGLAPASHRLPALAAAARDRRRRRGRGTARRARRAVAPLKAAPDRDLGDCDRPRRGSLPCRARSVVGDDPRSTGQRRLPRRRAGLRHGPRHDDDRPVRLRRRARRRCAGRPRRAERLRASGRSGTLRASDGRRRFHASRGRRPVHASGGHRQVRRTGRHRRRLGRLVRHRRGVDVRPGSRRHRAIRADRLQRAGGRELRRQGRERGGDGRLHRSRDRADELLPRPPRPLRPGSLLPARRERRLRPGRRLELRRDAHRVRVHEGVVERVELRLVDVGRRHPLRLRGQGSRDRERRMTTAVAAPGGQLARYLVVGVTNTAISFAVYALLAAAGLPYVPAAAVAFAAGAVNGYVLNRRWTFSAPDSARARIAYVCVQAAGALATGALVWLLAHETAAGRIGAYVVAVPPVTVSTFVANRAWTFAHKS